ncbi:MAG: biotin synthase BioB [Deltaproteobacteria bacterium]|jgi:biotin synthase|nr:biotin synthase BioB [Deltaproteobacteria bacterium]
MITQFENLAAQIMRGQALSQEQAAGLLALLPNNLLDLCALARLSFGFAASAQATALPGVSGLSGTSDNPAPFTCGIINAKSGRCAENCAFCAQSKHHATTAPIYPLVSEKKLRERAGQLAEAGVNYLGIVISGTTPSDRDLDNICAAAARISAEGGIKLCASLGLLGAEQARRLKQAGFTSYHHNLETAPSFYPEICGTHGIEPRLQTVRNAVAAGLRVCCGGIFGLGESWAQRLELSALLQDLEVHSIPVNFLTPIPGTPLADRGCLPPQEALAVVALLRLMHPGRDIVICGGRSRTLGEWENMLFAAGANGLMVGDYLTTPGGLLAKDLAMLETLGLRHV